MQVELRMEMMSSRERKRSSTTNPEAWSAFITAEVAHFVREFQGIEILVTANGAAEAVSVRVHAPYMQQSVSLIEKRDLFDRLPPRHRDRLVRVKAARENAPADAKAFLDHQFRGPGPEERMVAQGRAKREEIQQLLQEAVDRRVVLAGEGKPCPDGYDLRQWLVQYGIGVDCSAFAQQALDRLMGACHAAAGGGAGQRIGQGVGWMTSSGVYADIVTGQPHGKRFEAVSTPARARPGDVLVKLGHIRIVASAQRADGDGLILNLAESSSAVDIPLGQAAEEAGIGPRLIQIKYREPHLAIEEQKPLRKRLCDEGFQAEPEEMLYILGRLRALDRLCRGHTAPGA